MNNDDITSNTTDVDESRMIRMNRTMVDNGNYDTENSICKWNKNNANRNVYRYDSDDSNKISDGISNLNCNIDINIITLTDPH